jgi:hypothetical protein
MKKKPENDPRIVLSKSRTKISQMSLPKCLLNYQPFWCGTLSCSETNPKIVKKSRCEFEKYGDYTN